MVATIRDDSHDGGFYGCSSAHPSAPMRALAKNIPRYFRLSALRCCMEQVAHEFITAPFFSQSWMLHSSKIRRPLLLRTLLELNSFASRLQTFWPQCVGGLCMGLTARLAARFGTLAAGGREGANPGSSCRGDTQLPSGIDRKKKPILAK